MKSLIEDFKAFAIRGNVIDLAVAVIIGTAFGKIVSSLVDTMLMPVIGFFLNGTDFSGLAVTVGKSSIEYGKFIQATIDFVIIAFVVFMVLRILNSSEKKASDEPVLAQEPSEEIMLLREIRDSLKK